jgi:Divergent InlB B-repeat domain
MTNHCCIRFLRFRVSVLLCLIAAVMTSACSGGGSGSGEPPPSTSTSATLTIVKTGTATGTLTSNPAGINCGVICTMRVTAGTVVILTAAPTPNNTLTSWGGACPTASATCTVTATSNLTVTATFDTSSANPGLTVIPAGTGAGTVTCNGGICNSTYPWNTSVTLSGVPQGGSYFAGWSGGGCTGTADCTVRLWGDTAVTATFNPTPVTAQVSVTKDGTGTGTVTSNPAGIDCSATCIANFPGGTVVTLTASAAVGSTFAGWSGGGCSGTGTCAVTLIANTAVTAIFNTVPAIVSLAVATSGTGTGTVTCNSTTCNPSYSSGTALTIVATPAATSVFSGWGGDCVSTGSAPTCNLTLTANASVSAAFNLPTLSIVVAGTGTVTSNPAGITCGATCTASFNKGTSVTLTSSGPGFGGWSGGGCSGTGTCTITLNASTTVTATFGNTAVPGVFTYRYDNARTGQNLEESILTPTNVNPTNFGKLFSYPVDGQIYAQPLYMPNVTIGGQIHNVVVVATEHDSVYAFDADNPGNTPLWQTSFINPSAGVTPVPNSDYQNCPSILPEHGITSTPVIDPASGTLYLVTDTKENGNFFYRLHALSVSTGAVNNSVQIQVSVPGTGDGNDGQGNVPFVALQQRQRAALLLSNGMVYVGFASDCDIDPYHGWLLGYDASSLALRATFNSTPNGSEGGIWNGGPAADANGNVFVMTGNGTSDGPSPSGANDYGDSFLKLAGGALAVLDFFTPFNQAYLAANDLDLGSSCPLLLPDQSVGPPHLMVGGGKEGRIYLLNRDNLGHFQAGGDSQIVQEVTGQLAVGPSGESLLTAPAYFNNTVYFAANTDVLKAFSLVNGQLSTSPVAQAATPFEGPGASPVISAQGSDNGIVWLIEHGNPNPGVLHAYSAANVANELYNSNMNPGDVLHQTGQFANPTVANGKVYVGTADELAVFGLLP